MRDEHITALLDNAPPDGLSREELARAQEHVAHCAACRRAYHAARAAASLLKARAAATVEPPPFFKTRVMAAIRERQLAPEPWSFSRLWQSAGWLASAMAVLVLSLSALTFADYGEQPQTTATAQTADYYSVESAVLAADGAGDELTDSQVLTAIYESQAVVEESDGRNQ
jgi:predicted anti-sigma-YlaC factor YlaD